MHEVQRDVVAFHLAVCDVPDHRTPSIRRPKLRAELIREEAAETVAAIERGDLVEAIDGMCDLLAVVYGTAAEFGVDLEPFWDEVHRTNMAKVGGPVREDGKRLKPLGWTPPDIAGVLSAEVARYRPQEGDRVQVTGGCDEEGRFGEVVRVEEDLVWVDLEAVNVNTSWPDYGYTISAWPSMLAPVEPATSPEGTS